MVLGSSPVPVTCTRTKNFWLTFVTKVGACVEILSLLIFNKSSKFQFKFFVLKDRITEFPQMTFLAFSGIEIKQFLLAGLLNKNVLKMHFMP